MLSMTDHTGAKIKWNRDELKTMYLRMEGTSRATVSGISMSMVGIYQDYNTIKQAT